MVAQDVAGNIGYSNFNATTPVHASVTATPSPVNAVPASFNIITATPLSGVVTVGTGGDYTTLTKFDGLFKAIGDNGLSGDLTVKVITNTAEDGNQSLNQWAEYCGSGYTVTIVPTDATVRTLTGSLSGMGMFWNICFQSHH
ncbi:MAG: hypothetical protein IPP77_01920 [Bacteroidetes bacterium]|nr:hypothetical protein [Bacteroidota bacterium]